MLITLSPSASEGYDSLEHIGAVYDYFGGTEV